MEGVNTILQMALREIEQAQSLSSLAELKVKYLGKKGQLTELLKDLGSIEAALRPQVGQHVNVAKKQIQEALELRTEQLSAVEINNKLTATGVDVTLPGRLVDSGSIHPVTKAMNRIFSFFVDLGFDISEGLEIEDDYHNFTALNIPEHHPARAMHDTFYFADKGLLRTHTSTVQIRAMRNQQPPLRLISCGRVYRCDYDLTHTPMFHQFEGLMIDEGITFAHLKGILSNFIREFFEKDLQTRLRPSYFPFTEPSAELDIQCIKCMGKGCRICKETGWLEVLGCGMVHPKVLQNCNIDSERYTGFAWGCGIDRLAMLRYEIPDLRMLFENDLRFLQQFG